MSSAGKAESDSVSTAADSPTPDSPTANPKSKIEVKLTPDGQLVFNARQRRTLRRALCRRAKSDTASAERAQAACEDKRQLVIDVVQLHIGRALPGTTNIDELVKMLTSNGPGEGGDA